jgi:predicted ATPase
LKRLERRLPLLVGGARDVDERQQTMRNTLAWSYDLLASEEQRLFRRLAVFVGGCTLDAVEAVCSAPDGAEPLANSLLDGLGRLVDQSLVQQREEDGEPRFRMLHVIREFALEQLEASGEAEALRWAHVRSVLTLAAVSHAGLRAGSAARWLAQMEREHDNLRAALGWALDCGEVRLSLRLGIGFAPFWWARGYYGEGRRWMARVVGGDRPSPVSWSLVRPTAVSMSSSMYCARGPSGGWRNSLGTRATSSRREHGPASALMRRAPAATPRSRPLHCPGPDLWSWPLRHGIRNAVRRC